MKKILLLITGYLSTFTLFAQVYSDTFDANLTVANTNFYTAALSNGNLVITGNGGATAYQTFSYQMHNNGTLNSVDISNDLVLYIKAKGTGLPDLRIDLQDDDGNATNLSSSSVKLKDEFEILSIDFTGKLLDAYSGKPGCAVETPCDVDASKTAVLAMFVNAANGGYDGTIEIEWISFGAPLEALPEASEFDIRYNQLAYVKGQKKLINIIGLGTFNSKAFTVYNSSNQIELYGTTGASTSWNASGENVATIDITAIDTEGAYRFVIDEGTEDEQEVTFNISEDAFSTMREEAFKYYYYNRASTELTSQYAGVYARPTGIADDVVYVHKSAATAQRPTGTQISAPKGWYDAGDYNKYVVNSGISTYTLLAAYEHYSNYFNITDFSIPEQGGNIPDILDETIWNLDWLLAMQDPNDGGVYHKLTALSFSGNVMPANYNFDRYVVQKSTSAALNFAAVTAVASRIFSDYENEKPGFSAQLLQASKDAYTWAKANPTIYYEQGTGLLDDVVTGAYDDTDVTDEFQWAATELFITTGDQNYENDIDVNTLNGGTPGWQKVNSLALISIAHHSATLPTSITTTANATLLGLADALKNTVNTSAMNVAMAHISDTNTDFVWGSNGVASNQIILLIRAFSLTNDTSYLDAAYNAIDYLFGRNGTGYSFVTGFGDETPIDPHHRISVSDGITIPVPGMLVGGPHSGQQDVGTNSWECAASVYPSTLPAKSYTDNYCSYSTNEITINWNAPFMYSLHALYAIQTGNDGTLSNADNYSEAFKEKFEVYPNPTSDTIYLKSLEAKKKGIIEIFTLEGKKVNTTTYDKDNSSIDLSKSANGVYLMRITLGNDTFTTKIVKE